MADENTASPAVDAGATGPEAAAPAGDNPAAEAGSNAASDNAPANTGKENEPDSASEQDQGANQENVDKADIEDQPITDWSAVDLGLPENAAVDEATLAAFGQKAVEMGLTPKQAKGLIDWQLGAIKEAREAQLEAGVEELRKAWGRKAEANQKAVVGLISRIDRQLGNEEFSRAIGASGAANSPAFCKGLLAIAGMLSEDSMGRSSSAEMPLKPETALEGIENAFREMKART